MSSQVTVFDKEGTPLADLDVDVFRSWVLNGYGEASFTISTRDNKCREEFLQYGNRLLVQHDKLPEWVGIMDTPRVWKYGSVECHALGAEVWFDWRLTHVHPMYDTLANVFRFIIDSSNSWGGSQMQHGIIRSGGIATTAALGGKASDHIMRLVDKYMVDWSVTPYLSGNKLFLRANMYGGSRGENTGLTLNNINSKNVEPTMTEDGAIYNHVFYYSEPGEGGGRKFGDARDNVSVGKYDLRMIAEQGVGSYEEGLEFSARMKLLDTKEPFIMVAPSALDVGETFRQLRLGNVIYWENDYTGFAGASVGSNSTVRIVGMEYSETDKSVGLVVELLRRYYTRQEKINMALEGQ